MSGAPELIEAIMKGQFLTKKYVEKCDMTSVNQENTLEYLDPRKFPVLKS